MTETEHNPRHIAWFSTFVLSIIALVSLLTMKTGKVSSMETNYQWAVSAISVSLALSGLAVIANWLARSKFVGTFIEGGLALIIFIFWAVVLPYLMKPGNDLATDEIGGIISANLYFFSWGAFLASLLVFVGCLKDQFKVGQNDKNPQFAGGIWAGLCMASFVLFVSAVRIYQIVGCSDLGLAFCKRTKFAVALGVISAVLSLIWLFVGACLAPIFDMIMSTLLFIAWIFGISFITFGGDKAPGSIVGNTYFSTWAGFILTALLFSKGLRHMFHKDEETAETTTEEKKDEAEVGGGGEEEEVQPEEGA